MNEKKLDYDLSDLLDLVKKDVYLNLNCHAVGTVQSFDPTKQTVQVTINYKKSFFDLDPETEDYVESLRDYPILLDCPVAFMGGANNGFSFPVAKSDECLILFNDRDIDNWFTGSAPQAPASDRLHSLSDGIALMGVRSGARPITSFDANGPAMYNQNAKVRVKPTTILIGNNTTTLNTLLQNLITQIKAITVTCAGSGSPSSIPINAAALTTIANNIANLLE